MVPFAPTIYSCNILEFYFTRKLNEEKKKLNLNFISSPKSAGQKEDLHQVIKAYPQRGQKHP